MGKMLEQQRRGKGSPSYKRPSHRFKVDLCYRPYDEAERSGALYGEVVNFVDDPGRSALLMEVQFPNNEKRLMLAPEGAFVGQRVQAGASAELQPGNVLPLSAIPDGTPIYNIEIIPGDGGKMARVAGTSAYVVSREGGKVTVRLPSKKIHIFSGLCRAQIGVICGGGRLERPFMTAGRKMLAMNAVNRRWPHVRGVAMNPYDHPFGGKEHHRGRPSTVSRSTPPGRKVGHLAARSTGRGGRGRKSSR
ncbi:MAG: 50S ribosomal protein L2 [Candidatus Micrarchaeota archaeon]